MTFTQENIKITHFLAGFHSFTKDHNYPKFKGDLINDLSQELNLTFESFSIGPESIIKTADRDPNIFEIKITPNAIIYQDALQLEEFQANSIKFLNIWRKYSSRINLRLVGLVRNFNFLVDPMNDEKKLYLTNSFFKGKEIWDKINTSKMTFRFSQVLEGVDYNIHITLSENRESNYELSGLIDFNQTIIDKQKSISDDDISRIFFRSNQYFENEFVKFLS